MSSWMMPCRVKLVSGYWLCSLLLLASIASAQEKKSLDHSDYDLWNSVSQQSISNDGQWILYTIRPGKGDATLKIRHTGSSREYSVVRGSGANFSADSKFAAYTIAPDPEVIKQLRKEEKSPDEFPQTQLEILELATGKHATIDAVQSFSMPDEAAGWIAYRLRKPPESETVKEGTSTVSEAYEVTSSGLVKAEPEKKESTAGGEGRRGARAGSQRQAGRAGATGRSAAGQRRAGGQRGTRGQAGRRGRGGQGGGGGDDEEGDAGTTLVLRNLSSGVEQRFPNVVSFRFTENGDRLAYATSAEDADSNGVVVVDTKRGTSTQITSGKGRYRSLTFNKDGDQLAFLTDRDDQEAKTPSWAVYLWKSNQKQAAKIASQDTSGIPEGWWVADAGPSFTEVNQRLLFSTAPKPDDLDDGEDEDEENAEDEEPKAQLDLWHWQDPELQPQQLLQANRERNRSYRAAYDLASGTIIQLERKDMPSVQFDGRSTTDVGVGVATEKYAKMRSWESPSFQDYYLVDLTTGERELILEMLRGNVSLSPEGNYITWWDSDLQKWFAMSTADKSKVDIGQGISVPLYNELHDTPSQPRAHGSAGWMDGESAFLLYDRYDIWKVDPTGQAPPTNLTQNAGRESKIRFRYTSTDPEERSVPSDQPMLLSAFDETTKASGYFSLDLSSDEPPQQIVMLDESLGGGGGRRGRGGLNKAKDTNDVVVTRSTFRRFPDLWHTTTEFKRFNRISDANPQQSDYLWGTAELVHWTATDGQALDGLLYKPDGFDPNQKYPMMVYFYERNSDNLHRYQAPSAGSSSINYSFYVSRGYVLFVPDIPYKVGYPGPSAANSILSGVQHLIDQGFVDEKGIGTQGHSWGGYQTAYLVTQTDMFAAAESGAPVSNMTSAYGGIRWQTGLSRMFQYERTQSRIGDTLWDARDKYLENSPLFFADKINTPLLILHNDEDGAVPWYQGIELFVAMRRLEKPAWLVNYNGEPHGIRKAENRVDFAIRMQQFFDHYCKGAPAPKWLAHGIPAVDKGKDFGLELIEAEKETEAAATTSEGDKR